MSDAECPTGCGRQRRADHMMCAPCWAEVPASVQREVYRTWRAFQRAASTAAADFREKRVAYEAARDAALASVP